MGRIVTAAELAEIYAVDRRTVTNWLNETPPCPSDLVGNVRKFDLKSVGEWREARAVRREREHWEAPSSSKEEEELRKLRAEADMAEDKRDIQRGLYIHVDDVEQLLREPLEAVAAQVRNLPQRHSAGLVGMKTQRQAISKLKPVAAEMMEVLRAACPSLDYDDDPSPSQAA